MGREEARIRARSVALVYVRVSRLDEDERERKISPEMQREKALALLQVQGLETVCFEDLDISGKATTNRPGYQALLERLRGGDVRYVVAYDLSRITRTMSDQADFFDSLTEEGVLFLEASTGRVVDVKNEDEELSANVIGSVNQHARKKTARRVRDSFATKVARGDMVGPLPVGYVRRRDYDERSGKVVRTWVEPDPETAPLVRHIFAEYATGSFSLKTLAVSLNAEGLRPMRSPQFDNNRKRAELFTADVLKDILSNRRYMGRVPRKDGEEFQANFEALIDSETWAMCERVRFKHRSFRSAKAAKRPSRYLLSGVLRCGRCGSTMSGQTWKSDRTHPATRNRYTCYLRRTAKACDMPYVEQDQLEAQLIDILRIVAMPGGLAEAVDAAVAASLALDATKPRHMSLKTVDARLERLRDLYELGDLSRDHYLAKSDDLKVERKTLETSSPRPVFLRQRTMLRTLVDDWELLTLDERRALVGEIFEEITANETGVEDFLPRESWKQYMRAVVPDDSEKVPTERKTGLEPATLTLAR